MSYTISPDGKAITCNRCGLTSHNVHDVRHRFCGKCNIYHDDHVPIGDITPEMVKASPALQRILEEVRNPDHQKPRPGYYDRVYNRHNR